MKGLERFAKIGLAALLTISILFATVNAQSAIGLLNQSIVTAQDTVPAIKEGAALGVLNTSLKSLANQARRNRMIGGYVLLGLGVASGIGGATVLAFAESDDARIVGYSLGTLCIAADANGTIINIIMIGINSIIFFMAHLQTQI